jgi:D-alanyl-D-alanine carboxypeptidase/D-alanyl-D-alanine-endopeptidase (penicillin-binding protein 4)
MVTLCLAVCLAAGAQGTAAPAPATPPYPSGDATALGAQIAALLADPAVARAHWGIAVAALDGTPGGTPLWGLDEGKMFRPASVAKLFTTTAAMALLGPESTVDTTVSFLPPDASGTVQGNLSLSSGGDANLSGRELPYVPPGSPPAASSKTNPLLAIDDLADKVVAAGVKHVTGDLDASVWWEPYPQGWGTDDLLWGYGAPVSSLGIDDNEVRLLVTPASAVGGAATATLVPDVGYYRIDAKVSTTAKPAEAEVVVYRDQGDRTVHVSGGVALHQPYTTKLAIEDPPLYAALALQQELRARGVMIDGKVRATHEFAGNQDTFLQDSRHGINKEAGGWATSTGDCFEPCAINVKRVSVPLYQDVAVTLKESLNLHAEMMLRRFYRKSTYEVMEAATSNHGYFAQSVRVERQWLIDAGLHGDDFVFYDGSGLSVKDLVTPRATAQLLAYAATQPWFAQWKAALPVGGVDGTLASRFKEAPLKGHVYAKTGTLGESRALAGYVDAASGRTVIFCILVDNHTPGSSADRVVMDKIVAAIAANN